MSADEERAAAELWKGFGGWVPCPPLMTPHSKRGTENYTTHTAMYVARLRAMGEPGETEDMQTDLSQQLALRARWSRMDALLAPQSGLLPHLFDALLGGLSVRVVQTKTAQRWRVASFRPEEVALPTLEELQQQCIALESAIESTRVLVAASRAACEEVVIQVLVEFAEGPLWLGMAAGGLSGKEEKEEFQAMLLQQQQQQQEEEEEEEEGEVVAGAGAGTGAGTGTGLSGDGDGSASASDASSARALSGLARTVFHRRRRFAALCWSLLAELARRTSAFAKDMCDVGVMESILSLVLRPSQAAPCGEGGGSGSGSGGSSIKMAVGAGADADSCPEEGSAAVWATRLWRTCVLYGLSIAVGAVSELHTLCMGLTPVTPTRCGAGGDQGLLAVAVLGECSTALPRSVRLELLWLVEHAAAHVAAELPLLVPTVVRDVDRAASGGGGGALLGAKGRADALGRLALTARAVVLWARAALVAVLDGAATAAATEVGSHVHEDNAGRAERAAVLHLLSSLLGVAGVVGPCGEAAVLALRGEGLLAALPVLHALPAPKEDAEADPTVAMLLQQAREVTCLVMEGYWSERVLVPLAQSLKEEEEEAAAAAGGHDDVQRWLWAEQRAALARLCLNASSYSDDAAGSDTGTDSAANSGSGSGGGGGMEEQWEFCDNVRAGLFAWQGYRLHQVTGIATAATLEARAMRDPTRSATAGLANTLLALKGIGPEFSAALRPLVTGAVTVLVGAATAGGCRLEEPEVLIKTVSACVCARVVVPLTGSLVGPLWQQAGGKGGENPGAGSSSLTPDWESLGEVAPSKQALPLPTHWPVAALASLERPHFSDWLRVLRCVQPTLLRTAGSTDSPAYASSAGQAAYHLLSVGVDVDDEARWQRIFMEEEGGHLYPAREVDPDAVAAYCALCAPLPAICAASPAAFVEGFVQLCVIHNQAMPTTSSKGRTAEARAQRRADTALELYRAALNAATSCLLNAELHAAQLAVLLQPAMPWRARASVWQELGKLRLLQLANGPLLRAGAAASAGAGVSGQLETSRPVATAVLDAVLSLRSHGDREWPIVEFALDSLASFILPLPSVSVSDSDSGSIRKDRVPILDAILRRAPMDGGDASGSGAGEGPPEEDWLPRSVLQRLRPGAPDGWSQVQVEARESRSAPARSRFLRDVVAAARPSLR